MSELAAQDEVKLSIDIVPPDTGRQEDDPTSPAEVWKHMPPEVRTQVIKLLAQAAYEIISADLEDSTEVNNERTANHNQ